MSTRTPESLSLHDRIAALALMVAVHPRLAESFVERHRETDKFSQLRMALRHLDFALADAEAIDARYVAEGGRRAREIREQGALAALESHDGFSAIVDRKLYHLGLVYTMARRVLDHVTVVADATLPRTGTKLKRSHSKLRSRLLERCSEVGLEPPHKLLELADELTARVKAPRDAYFEHPSNPGAIWAVAFSSEGSLVVTTREVGKPGEPVEFAHPAAVVRLTREYVGAMLDFLEETLASGT